MTIDDILQNIPDKLKHHTTTSHLFKRDLFEFFNKPEFADKTCVEWGSNIGYTTRILSFLFKDVTGFNLEHADQAREFNSDRDNVRFYTQDIYNSELPINTGDVFFVDAAHTYEAVIADTLRSLRYTSTGKKYFIYDDYGTIPEVKQAITDLVNENKISILKKIGHVPGDLFHRPLYDAEGIICEEATYE